MSILRTRKYNGIMYWAANCRRCDVFLCASPTRKAVRETLARMTNKSGICHKCRGSKLSRIWRVLTKPCPERLLGWIILLSGTAAITLAIISSQ